MWLDRTAVLYYIINHGENQFFIKYYIIIYFYTYFINYCGFDYIVLRQNKRFELNDKQFYTLTCLFIVCKKKKNHQNVAL